MTKVIFPYTIVTSERPSRELLQSILEKELGSFFEGLNISLVGYENPTQIIKTEGESHAVIPVRYSLSRKIQLGLNYDSSKN